MPARVLVTGFGPFPGVADNLSARLVDALVRDPALRRSDLRLVSAVLPTVWGEVWDELRPLLDRERPDVIIHFGVSRRARGFCLERCAYNAATPRPDAAGCLSECGHVVPNGDEKLDASLPYHAMLDALQDHGLPARYSDDPGRYLCNFVLYRTLDWLSETCSTARAGFVHIPVAVQGCKGAEPEDDETPLTLDAIVLGGRLIVVSAVEQVRACVGQA